MIALTLHETQNPETLPEAVLRLVLKTFPLIQGREGFLAFFRKSWDKPLLLWLEDGHGPVAFYAMLTTPFVCDKRIVVGGRPELNAVDPAFIQRCVQAGVEYRAVDPMGQLHRALVTRAQEQGLDFLYCWPNALALGQYRRNGYTLIPFRVSVYTRPLRLSYVSRKTHRALTGALGALITLARGVSLPSSLALQPVEALRERDFPLEEADRRRWAARGVGFYPLRNEAVFQKRFFEERFRRYLVLHGGRAVGYVVLKVKEEDGFRYLWVADRLVAPELDPPLLALLGARGFDAVQVRTLHPTQVEQPSRSRIPQAYWIRTTLERSLAWLNLAGQASLDPQRVLPAVDDFLTEFSF